MDGTPGPQAEDRTTPFDGDDPVAILHRWLVEAERTEPSDPNAMTLATVDGDGMPNARIVLLKEVVEDGVVFFTNYDSDKGRELDAAGRAAAVLHWKSLRRQVRLRGSVRREEDERADAYYASRGIGSRIGAWASRQSHPLASRAELEARVESERLRLGDDPPRPPFWGGYRIEAQTYEFWADGQHRLHDRFRWIRDVDSGAWAVTRLNP